MFMDKRMVIIIVSESGNLNLVCVPKKLVKIMIQATSFTKGIVSRPAITGYTFTRIFGLWGIMPFCSRISKINEPVIGICLQ